MRVSVPGSPAPWWLLVAVVLVGAGLGWWLARELARAGYRLDDEQNRRVPRSAPLVAVAVSVLWGLLAWRLGGVAGGAVLPAFLLLGWAGMASAWIDLDVRRLPDGLTFPVAVALVVLLGAAAAVTGEWELFGRAVACGAAAWVIFVATAVVVPGGLGLGDATLAGLVALPLGFLGWDRPVIAIVVAYVAAGVVGLAGLATRRLSRRSYLAFGPFILLGALVGALSQVHLAV